MQVVLSLLKAHGIRKVVASPGATNVALIGSMQNDSYFEMYSSVDERSAAYIACGLAAESGEAIVISCTGATAARNYFPGLTEAFYRKLPILAITSSQAVSRVGHLVAQVTDRSTKPKDIARFSVSLPVVKDEEDLWDCQIKVNQAILELTRHGGGPAHINLPTQYDQNYDVKELPEFRVIRRITTPQVSPEIPRGRVGVFVGSHARWNERETAALDSFCAANNAVVFCDHTSGYRGQYRLLYALLGGQQGVDHSFFAPDLLVHIGEVSGDYYGIAARAKEIWRVNPDGEIRDTYRKLTHVFAMDEESFFEAYAKKEVNHKDEYFKACQKKLSEVRSKIPDLPFSNIWLASQLAHRIPEESVIHFGILNSLRSWNFFELPHSVCSASNVGGFGIDGGLSSLVGASLANPNKLYFCVIGDLAFFYDMNVLGNRHVGKNLRVLLVNNGKGTEFRQYGHHAAHFEDEADQFIAAAGHFGNKSYDLVRHYVEDLGFEYLSANTKESVLATVERFINPEITDRSVLFEVFTDSEEESRALKSILTLSSEATSSAKAALKSVAKSILGQKGTDLIKGWIK